MTEQKQPEALRLIAEWRNSMPIGVMRIWAADVRDELRRQHAEIEKLRAKLDELEKQEHAAFVNEQGFIIERDDMQISSGEKLYLAAGARPVVEEPAVAPIDEYQRGRMAGITEFYDSLYAIDQDRARAALHKIEPQPAPADGWLHSSGMLYRLTDERRPKNRDEINVTMADGSRSLESRSRRAGELLDCIRAMQAAADKKEPT